MKEESENVGVKFNIQKTKIMASGPITRGKYMGKQWKQWKQCQTLFFGASKSLQMVIAAIKLKDSCSLEGKLWSKVRIVKAMVFPVVMYGCKSWTIKKAEHQRIDGFELWCWRRLLRVPWTARRFNQSILKEISPVCSLEKLMLKLKLQYFGHLMWSVDAGKDWGQEKGMTEDEMVGWHHRLNGHEFG